MIDFSVVEMAGHVVLLAIVVYDGGLGVVVFLVLAEGVEEVVGSFAELVD